jgi:rod shape-determining protein MreC
VIAVLVILSIALITIYFRESSGGGLHKVQSAGATVLRPFEIGAERVARPFRDAYGYFAGLIHAKSQNNRLRGEVDRLRQQAALNTGAATDNAQLRRLLRFANSTSFPASYAYVGARIISRPLPEFEQQIIIDAGKSAGIREEDPVVSDDGLIGQVTKVAHNVAQVTLLTDDTSAVTAVDVQTGALGIVKQGPSGLQLDRVDKADRVRSGDMLMTAGWKTRTLSSSYPRMIPIGRVTYVSQNNVDVYKHVQLEPFANFRSLSYVLVLVPKNR